MQSPSLASMGSHKLTVQAQHWAGKSGRCVLLFIAGYLVSWPLTSFQSNLNAQHLHTARAVLSAGRWGPRCSSGSQAQHCHPNF